MAKTRDEGGDDPFLEAELDRALSSYEALLPPEMLQVFRETLSDVLTTHPLGARLLQRARPRPVKQTSETREKPGSEAEAAEAKPAKHGGKSS